MTEHTEDIEREQLSLFPSFVHVTQGKDEMNFAEFPIATLCKRPTNGAKTVVFEDQIFDKKARELVKRRLEITASDEYGLPTPFDDEVIFALVNIATAKGKPSDTLHFRPHQIISAMGWNNEGYYYQRIKESIKRWLGVSMHYENAWRDIQSKTWKDEGFHLIDAYTWGKDGESCSISWGKHVLKSLKGGNLRQIDLGFYRDLNGNTAKRMFRFLDKRFKLNSSQTFELYSFAHHKIGLSQVAYPDIAQVKRALWSSIEQLVAAKFLAPMPKKERFTKVAAGIWEVHFQRFSRIEQKVLEMDIEEGTESEKRLISIGYSKSQAKKDVSKYGEDYILERLLWSEYRMEMGAVEEANLPAYLNWSIKQNDLTAPKGYKTPAEIESERLQKAEIEKAKGIARKQEKAAQKAAESEIEAHHDKLWAIFEGLPSPERDKVRLEALKSGMFKSETTKKAAIISKIESMVESGEIENH